MNTWTTSKHMFSGVLIAAMTVVALGMTSGGAAASSTWTIQSTNGDARFVDQDGQTVTAEAGTEVDAGDRVVTGEDGRVVLARGEERITVSPSSDMGLPTENKSPYATQILQNLGTILLKVQKQPNQHFEVKTPYMAAVVKGTTFTVSVSDRGTAVHVVEGAVQVADLSGTQVQLVRPGQTATRGASANAPLDVSGIDAPAKKPAKKAEAAESDDGRSESAKADNAPAAASKANAADAADSKGPNGDGPSGGKGKGKANGTQIANAVGAVDLNLGSATSGLVVGRVTVGKAKGAERGASAGDAAPNKGQAGLKSSPGNSSRAGGANSGGNGAVIVASANTGSTGNGSGNGNSGSSNGNSANNSASNSNGGGNGNGNSGNSGNGNSGNSGNGNSGNSGNGNSGNSGNGNSGNGNSGNGNSGNGNSGNGNSGNGNSGNGNSGNGNSGNGNGNS